MSREGIQGKTTKLITKLYKLASEIEYNLEHLVRWVRIESRPDTIVTSSEIQ